MRVHPAPQKRITAARDVLERQKKLRRLPHVFSKMLELPFGSDADVEVIERSDKFQFIIATDDSWDDVRAHAIEIHPGVMKVVVRDGDSDLQRELEIDCWRVRLPPCTRPAMATAVYINGELVVTVPKGGGPEESGEKGGGDGEAWGRKGNGGFMGGGVARFVVVQ